MIVHVVSCGSLCRDSLVEEFFVLAMGVGVIRFIFYRRDNQKVGSGVRNNEKTQEKVYVFSVFQCMQ